MRCPTCLAPEMRMLISITADCPGGQKSLDKAAIRKKEVQIIAVDWPSARYYCSECHYHERVDK